MRGVGLWGSGFPVVRCLDWCLVGKLVSRRRTNRDIGTTITTTTAPIRRARYSFDREAGGGYDRRGGDFFPARRHWL
ncbi:hypothetical protein TIFTF001_015493 [Ficus carica]|uniref:Secreted protein n=1 Tax=Ficus carica TaxID=3494 RepID=A0AA88A7A7_FICCA|nr:hypothetical protein TIFTF001_015493 [Ficus carica]